MSRFNLLFGKPRRETNYRQAVSEDFKHSRDEQQQQALVGGISSNPDGSRSRDNFSINSRIDVSESTPNYDRKSRRSLSTSFASLSRAMQTTTTQTYFSLDRDDHLAELDETTSFYSALQDAFSLDDDDNNNYPEQGRLAAPVASSVSMVHLSRRQTDSQQDSPWPDSVADGESSNLDFQVYWHDIVYRIAPKLSLFSIYNDLERNLVSSLAPRFTSAARRVAKKGGEFDESDGSGATVKNSLGSPGKREPLTIIQNISGSFKSGELTAIMGPSGAGKTSLLNFLSRRREDGYSGELYVDTESSRRIKISTIPQCDHLPEYLTVRENLTFASRLKNTHLINYDHSKNIEKFSKLLGLDDCLDTRTKRISGGQHKRLAIAQELLSKPDILILDEPTSGLDSLTCYRTLTVLKNLVKACDQKLIDPIAIVVTIHQPQQEVFDLFDKIYVMANGGSCIYNGPPENCIEFIRNHTSIETVEKSYNPASFMIEIASGEFGLEPIKRLENQVKLEFDLNSSTKLPATGKHFSNIASATTTESILADSVGGKDLKTKASNGTNGDTKPANATRADRLKGAGGASSSSLYIDSRIAKSFSINRGHFFAKTRILIERCWLSVLRDPKQTIGRILFHMILPIAMAIIMGTDPGHANACPNFSSEYKLKDLIESDKLTSKDVQEEMFLTLENIGTIFIIMYALTCANIAATTLSFTLDMTTSLKEFYNGWYTMPSYMLARFISDIPMEIILPFITLSLSYPLTGQMTGHGLPNVYRILLTAGAVVLGSMAGQTMGMIFGAIYIGHVSTALFASQASTLPMAFLSGFVVRTKNMSKLVYALSKFSFYKHTLEVAAIARYGFDVCNCKSETISGQDAQISGVPETLKSFTKYWMSAYSDEDQSVANENSSSINLSGNSSEENGSDVFQLFAKQVSLYNTYGIEVKSCDDVKPYQLHDLSLSESDIPTAFLALIGILLLLKIILFFTVKLVIHFRTSL